MSSTSPLTLTFSREERGPDQQPENGEVQVPNQAGGASSLEDQLVSGSSIMHVRLSEEQKDDEIQHSQRALRSLSLIG